MHYLSSAQISANKQYYYRHCYAGKTFLKNTPSSTHIRLLTFRRRDSAPTYIMRTHNIMHVGIVLYIVPERLQYFFQFFFNDRKRILYS